MLNTSLHNHNVRDKPTAERFITMNRGINEGGDLPEELLRVSCSEPAASELSPSLLAGPYLVLGPQECHILPMSVGSTSPFILKHL